MTIDTAGSAPAQPVVPAAPKKSVFERITGVFFAPEETFADIARKPDVIWPLVILTVVAIISAILITPRMDLDAMMSYQAEVMQKKNPNMSDADIERMAPFVKATSKVMGYISPILMIAGYVLIAVVLWGAFRLMGGEGDFKQAFSTTLWAHFPRMVLGAIIGTVIVMLRGSVDPMQIATVIKTSPAFIADFKEQPVLYALLASFDIFALWTLFLLGVGFSKVSRLSKGKSFAIVISLWLVIVLFKVGMAALNAAQMRG
jgi:Yip1 domain